MKKNLAPLIVLAVLAVFPLAVQDNYYRHLMILFLMWVVIGSAWNLIAGYTGQVSFGDAAFFGSGAYAAGLLSTHLHISAWGGIALGGCAAGITTQWIVQAKPGYYFVSIREDQDAAESLGINTHYYKMLSLAIAAFWTGVAGPLYMNYIGFIDTDVVFPLHDISIMAILVGIVGGVGTIYGPMVGAFVMVTVQELFRSGFFGLFKFLAEATGSGTLVKK